MLVSFKGRRGLELLPDRCGLQTAGLPPAGLQIAGIHAAGLQIAESTLTSMPFLLYRLLCSRLMVNHPHVCQDVTEPRTVLLPGFDSPHDDAFLAKSLRSKVTVTIHHSGEKKHRQPP